MPAASPKLVLAQSLLGEDGDGLATGGSSSGCVSGLQLRRGASLSERLLDGPAAPAALFATHLPSGVVDSPLCFASEAAQQAAAAFFSESSFLDA